MRLLTELANCDEPWIYRAKGFDGLGVGKLPALNSAWLIKAIKATQLATIVGLDEECAVLDTSVRAFHMYLLLEEP
jgi:hypothetical protein